MGMGNNPISSVDLDGGFWQELGNWLDGNGWNSNAALSYQANGGELGNWTGGVNGYRSAGTALADGSFEVTAFDAVNDLGGAIINFGFMINGNGGWDPKTHANHVGDKSIDMTYSNAPFEVIDAAVEFLMNATSKLSEANDLSRDENLLKDSMDIKIIRRGTTSGRRDTVYIRQHNKTRESRRITKEESLRK